MADTKKLQIDVASLKIDTPENMRGGVYANAVNVAASGSEVTINFIYINPTDDPQATLVSRVIVPPALLNNISDSINSIIEELKKQEDK